ncbi:MAG: LD-carboxypeptidase [Oceanospirillaceae bacterium]|nr:LD-carboxypeptidase [Oceanospirillaceae bacterium]
MTKIKVDVVATSSVVPKVELERGLVKLSALGFSFSLAENALTQDFAYAGDPQQRAKAFYDAAMSDSELVWAIRGGYGAAMLLRHLAALDANAATPKPKILIGYSDLTALNQFVSERWGWKILHAPMIASNDFHQMRIDDEAALMSFISGNVAKIRTKEAALTWIHRVNSALDNPIEARLNGGNLAVICSMIGTPWQLDFSGKIVFLEEIGESWCKIERMLQQLLLSGLLDKCKAVVLGEFSNCFDSSPRGLISDVDEARHNLRVVLTPEQAMQRVFSDFGSALNVPVCASVTVGHCAENSPLPLLANYRLCEENDLEFLSW